MGAKDSKPCCILYEEAVARVSDAELKRLRDAFKRASTLNGIITKQAFIKEVLGEGVPPTLAEHIFQACGGTHRGITFKDLLCGLVLLTRGQREEKLKFIFSLYANESGTAVVKDEMVRLVQACEGGFVPEAVAECFLDSERVSFEEFRVWLLRRQDATTLTRWLLQEPCSVSLSNDMETPTFYQTLAGVTHLEESDIAELEKRYWMLKAQSRTGKFDLDTLIPLISPAIPAAVYKGFFDAFDENRDGHIDFKEMACGISASCRGPTAERQKFCFKIFDSDRDGLLSRQELEKMVEALIFVRRENRTLEELFGDTINKASPRTIVDEILTQHDSNQDECITLDEYLVWTVDHPLPLDFLNLLFQVCHVVLGLRPATKEDEGEVIRGWLEREERRGLHVGNFWYLVSMEWWRSWHEYINYQAVSCLPVDSWNVVGKMNGPSNQMTCLSANYSSSGRVGGNGSQNNSLKRTKLQRKACAGLDGCVARGIGEDCAGVVVTSLTQLTSEEQLCTGLDGNSVSAGLPRNSSTGSIGSASLAKPPQTLLSGVQQSSAFACSPKKSTGSILCLTGAASSTDFSRCNSSSSTSSPSQSPRIGRRPNVGGPVAALTPPQRPGAIDNTPLIVPATQKVLMLTGEGGKLKRNVMLTRGRDFELVSEPIWSALSQWYGGTPALPRQVILPSHCDNPELELYPVCLRLLRHHVAGTRQQQGSTWPSMVGGYGATALGATGYNYSPQIQLLPKRYLAYTASFSRLATIKHVFDFLCIKLRLQAEDMRLWNIKDENNQYPLEEEFKTLEELGVEDNEQVLIEVRNKDQTWPEEMSSLANRNNRTDKKKQAPSEKGATGLNNLGNTCFMNAALQCVSNTRPLTQYFTSNRHLYELNRINPHGMKGHIAKRYGDLVHELWSGTLRTTAPLKLRWTIGKYAPRFNGFQQHDSQELLAFLLDGLHEDLNRVHDKPYLELKDSNGRSDIIVAQEAWENHILRNKSVIVDLFHGQLKSTVTCRVCSHESVRFDPFTYLSLPLPMESCIHVEVVVFRLDGSVPVRFGLRLNMDEKYRSLKQHLSELCLIPASQLMLAEICGAMIKSIPSDDQKIRSVMTGQLFSYEVPSPGADSSDEGRNHQEIPQPAAQTLTQIQRLTHSGSANQNLSKKPALSNSPESCANNYNNVPHEPQRRSSQQEITDQVHADLNGTAGDFGAATSLPPAGPSLSNYRNSSSCSSSSSVASSAMSTSMVSCSSQPDFAENFHGFVVAYHRKMMRQDVYFLSSQKTRVSVFGLPLILPCGPLTSQQDLYQAVWLQVSRLVSPLPPSEVNVSNHAQDCDDSLGYEYPFTLKAVQKDGTMCAWCPWHRFCRGCKIDCCDTAFNLSTSCVAIDWDPTALHLRYQASHERMFVDHPSVECARRLQSEPINLDTCLQAFTKEEELGEDEKYDCSKCKKRQLAAKKLQIWRLPPILIIHLKRFQFVNGRWVKSQKIVKFPKKNLDPTNYLATIPHETVQRQHGKPKAHPGEVSGGGEPSLSVMHNGIAPGSESLDENRRAARTSAANEDAISLDDIATAVVDECPAIVAVATTAAVKKSDEVVLPSGNAVWVREEDCIPPEKARDSAEQERRKGASAAQSPSDNNSPIPPACNVPQDFHQHRLKDGINPYYLKYQLYAISCHSGILGGGHYICYACNPNNHWYCYNDSSCKEVSEDQIDSDSAYMLFYEREGMDYEQYMPSVEGKQPDLRDIDDEFESDFKKLCSIQ